MPVVRSFENPEESFARMSAEGFARMIGQVADLALVMDAADGTIRDVAFGGSGLAEAGLGALVGRRLAELVTSESQAKLDAMLAGGGSDGRWRQLTFLSRSGEELPIGFQLFGMGGARLLGVGRDERGSIAAQRRFLAAQHALEAEHARLRQSEMRFHTLLALSDLAVLTLDGGTLEVLDASGVAADRLSARVPDVLGRNFLALLEPAGAAGVRDRLVQAAAGAPVEPFPARLRDGGDARFQVALFRHGDAARLLVRMLDRTDEASRAPGGAAAETLLARLRQGVAITAADLRIVRANRAFVDLAQLSTEANAVGQPLERFVGRNGVDTSILAATLREQEAVRGFATVMVGAFGSMADVEIDAVRLGSGGDEQFGFFVRTAERGRRRAELGAHDRSGLVERMTDVVGRVALKEIVRDTTDAIEKLCIETALGLTGNNRAAAAELLGISRQSLYSKLARYGIAGPDDTAELSVQSD